LIVRKQSPANVARSNSNCRVSPCVIARRASEHFEADDALLEALYISSEGALHNVFQELLRAFTLSKLAALNYASQLVPDFLLTWGQISLDSGGEALRQIFNLLLVLWVLVGDSRIDGGILFRGST
jgi:hypothetical protein